MGLKADKAEVKHGVSKRKWLLLDFIVALESFGKTSQEFENPWAIQVRYRPTSSDTTAIPQGLFASIYLTG